MQTENFNLLWCAFLLEAFQQRGLSLCVVSPGSRSTPLTLAAARHPQLELKRITDERSAAFFALGYARATGKAAALICTSGTAVANYYPALIEAAQDHIPLIVLSADRPPELQFSGANQSIVQTRIFSDYPVFQRALTCPDEHLPPAYLLQLAAECWEKSAAGPVHLNLPFREPLDPQTQTLPLAWLKAYQALCENKSTPVYTSAIAQPSPEALDKVITRLKEKKRGLILLGRLPRDLHGSTALNLALQKINWPVFADLLSGFRFQAFAQHLRYHDLLLQLPQFKAQLQLDALVLVGDSPVSGPLLKWLKTLSQKSDKPEIIQFLHHQERADPHHMVDHLFRGEILTSLKTWATALSSELAPDLWLKNPSQQIQTLLEPHLNEDWQEPPIIHQILKALPSNWSVFTGNSLSIRQLNSFAATTQIHRYAANRGTSGIDGNLSTALGWSEGLKGPVALICGDLTLLHDLNALGLLRQHQQPFLCVVINNDGGGIFHFLPIARHAEHFEAEFGTPHGLDFKGIAQGFGLHYAHAQSHQSLQSALDLAILSGQTGLIEVKTQRQANYSWHQKMIELLAQHLPEGELK